MTTHGTSILDFLSTERASLSSTLDDAEVWLGAFGSNKKGTEMVKEQEEKVEIGDGTYNSRLYGKSYGDIETAKMQLKGSIENLQAKVSSMRADVGPLSPISTQVYQEYQQYQQHSPLNKKNNSGITPHDYSLRLSPHTFDKSYIANPTNYTTTIKSQMNSLMGKVRKEVDIERTGVEDKMKRYAIKETETRLNDMRRGHVAELEKVLGDTVMTVAGTLVVQDDRQVEQLRRGLEGKRDEMVGLAREEKFKGLEVAVNLMGGEQERKLKRLVMARRELEQNLNRRLEEIGSENGKESERVFGELAVALEEGARRNVEQLVERFNNEREEKEKQLVAHSEKVVGEAMESLSAELLESERSELMDIRRKAEEDRVRVVNQTRIEGTEALDKAILTEKERIRKRRDDKITELRSELQSKTMRDLDELEEALRSDLNTAEKLMIDSVKTGLSSTLQRAASEHQSRAAVNKVDVEDLVKLLKVKETKVITALPKFVRDARLRVKRFEKPDDGGLAEMVAEGKAWDALKALSDLHVGPLQERVESAMSSLQEITSENKSLRGDLKKLDRQVYEQAYGGDEFVFGLVQAGMDQLKKGEGGDGGGGKGKACRKCEKLYRVNGELLREINAGTGGLKKDGEEDEY
ncbi:hypothetical protein TrLO_g1010 [Triparma laevis f. longispina]|uniref:Uncharacterized protein n=1 Tax=Triparma laevis f. longispina TaxID=1714387 RepID=A0A9W7AMM8_9STRA|nr:hypothetical protein TrLO_g1010 [Triparma laevis f. longispina]